MTTMARVTDTPTISVVVGCVGAPEGAATCIEALRAQLGDGELLVCAPAPASAQLRERFAGVAFHERHGALVPELWRDGIDLARGPVVALTISPMVPAADWITVAQQGAERYGAFAGAIDPAEHLPLGDLAECLCRYARDMTPFEPRNSADIPGDNCAYRAELLQRTREVWRDGFWEPDVNRAIEALGTTPRHDPGLRVRQGRSAGTRAFLRQRLVHGRAHGRQRGARFSHARNLIGVAAAPAIPALLIVRTYQELATRSRLGGRTLAALPWLVLYDVAWAVGEARGHLDALRGR